MKINDKNLAAFATSGSQIDKEGYLMKKGDGNKGFSKRWFVLKGNLLFYFEKKSDREPLGVIILEGSTVELAESELEEHFCFKVIFPSRAYILSSESQQAMEQWMKALACASYDYVKLMAAELQRQLDELCKSEVSQTGSLGDNSNIQHPGGVPTPPPRARIPKHQRPSHQQKSTFVSLHEEYGNRILKDQRARWTGEQGKTSKDSTTQSALSVLQQDTMNF